MEDRKTANGIVRGLMKRGHLRLLVEGMLLGEAERRGREVS